MTTLGTETLYGNGIKQEINYTSAMAFKQIKVMFEQAGGEALSGYYWTAHTTGSQPYTIVSNEARPRAQISVANKWATDASTRAFIRF